MSQWKLYTIEPPNFEIQNQTFELGSETHRNIQDLS